MKSNARLLLFVVLSTVACTEHVNRIVIMGADLAQSGEDHVTFDMAFQTSSLTFRQAPKEFAGTLVVDDRARGQETRPGREVCRATFGPADLDWTTRQDKVARVRVQTNCPPRAADDLRYGRVEISIPGNTPSVVRGEIAMHGPTSSAASPRSSASSGATAPAP